MYDKNNKTQKTDKKGVIGYK